MDSLFVKALKVETCIGIYDWERQVRQRVEIDLEMAAEATTAAAVDRVEATIDYQAVCQRLVDYVEAAEVQLVETLAEGIAHILRTEFGVTWMQITIHKPGAVRGAEDVGVRITRGQRAD
ncbi:MAG: dihydroneopterin aldolase [Acidithiobacillus sp.]|uniref:dihydroneopterin aldolase n=1 Tax=Acidithiobacillus sp. TaxID=1872118 RepID=UPI003D04A9B9